MNIADRETGVSLSILSLLALSVSFYKPIHTPIFLNVHTVQLVDFVDDCTPVIRLLKCLQLNNCEMAFITEHRNSSCHYCEPDLMEKQVLGSGNPGLSCMNTSTLNPM